jgi:hypothetical protein
MAKSVPALPIWDPATPTWAVAVVGSPGRLQLVVPVKGSYAYYASVALSMNPGRRLRSRPVIAQAPSRFQRPLMGASRSRPPGRLQHADRFILHLPLDQLPPLPCGSLERAGMSRLSCRDPGIENGDLDHCLTVSPRLGRLLQGFMRNGAPLGRPSLSKLRVLSPCFPPSNR